MAVTLCDVTVQMCYVTSDVCERVTVAGRAGAADGAEPITGLHAAGAGVCGNCVYWLVRDTTQPSMLSTLTAGMQLEPVKHPAHCWHAAAAGKESCTLLACS